MLLEKEHVLITVNNQLGSYMIRCRFHKVVVVSCICCKTVPYWLNSLTPCLSHTTSFQRNPTDQEEKHKDFVAFFSHPTCSIFQSHDSWPWKYGIHSIFHRYDPTSFVTHKHSLFNLVIYSTFISNKLFF